MSDKAKTKAELLASTRVVPVLPGSPELVQLIASGYDGMTPTDAKEIVEARKKDAHSYPYDMQKKAEAVIAANKTAATVISQRPMFKRSPQRA